MCGPWRQPNEPIFRIQFFLESRLSSESLKALIGVPAYLAYLEQVFWLKKGFGKNIKISQKAKPLFMAKLPAAIPREQNELESYSIKLKMATVFH